MRAVDANGQPSVLHGQEKSSEHRSNTPFYTPSSRGRDRLHSNLQQAVLEIKDADSLVNVVSELLSTIQNVFHCDVSLVYVAEADMGDLVPHIHIRASEEHAMDSSVVGTLSIPPGSPTFRPLRLADCSQRLQLSPYRWPSSEGRPARKCALFETLDSAGFSTWFSIPLRAGKQTVGFVAVGYFHYQYLLDDVGQILWEFAQDVMRALLPHLPAHIGNTRVETREAVDLPSLYQQERMRRLLTNHHELTNTLWANDNLPSIMESLSFIVHQPVALLDSFFYPLVTYPVDTWSGPLPSIQQWMAHQHNSSHVRLPLSVRTDPLDEETFVITPVQMGSTILGYLVVWERGSRLDDLDVMALQQSTTILAVHFYKHGLHIERLGHGFSELFSALLDNPTAWDEHLTAQALGIGWDVGAKQSILVAKPVSEEVTGSSHDTLQNYLEQLRIRLAADYPSVFVTRYQDHVVFAVPECLAKDEPMSKLIHRILSIGSMATNMEAGESASGRGEVRHRILSFGLSEVADSPVEIADAYTEAVTAAALAPLVASNHLFVRADDVRVYLILQPVASLSAAQRFVSEQLGPLAMYDRDHHSELTKTLRTYLHFNGNLTDTARALFIHRTSLQYRLARIEGLLQRQLEDAKTRMELHLALAFQDIQDAGS